MKGKGVKRVRSGDRKVEEVVEPDRLISLPRALLLKILSNLQTKEAVKTSLLSTRWRNVWRSVPRLDLDGREFGYDYKSLVSFSERFLGFNPESSLQTFTLIHSWNDDGEPDKAQFKRWINTVVDRKVQRLNVFCRSNWVFDEALLPPSVYTCESLVSLVLGKVALPEPESVVTLPCVEFIKLSAVSFANDLAFEKLISGCPLLESLVIGATNVKVLRVRSQSLLHFTLSGTNCDDQGVAVEMDAPKLEYLRLSDNAAESFTANNLDSLVTASLDIEFRNPRVLSQRDKIRKFVSQISNTRRMLISSRTLKVLYNHLSCQKPLPLFHNLSYIFVTVIEREMLPILLKSCPNLKSLVLRDQGLLEDEICVIYRKPSFLPSLEYVEIRRQTSCDKSAMNLVAYFLEYSAKLKKLTLCLASETSRLRKPDSVILEELRAIPQITTSCQIDIRSIPIFSL